jgi:hypothetical protein
MKIIALDAAKGSEKERTAWWHHHPTPRRRLAVLSLSLSLSALPMQLHDRVGGTVIESPYEKKNSILQIKVAIYDACDRLS